MHTLAQNAAAKLAITDELKVNTAYKVLMADSKI